MFVKLKMISKDGTERWGVVNTIQIQALLPLEDGGTEVLLSNDNALRLPKDIDFYRALFFDQKTTDGSDLQ